MKNNTKTIDKKPIEAYSINQAFVGLGLKEADASTLRYLNYFASQAPIAAAHFMHILPKHNLLTALYEKETQMLISQYTIDKDRTNQMKEEVKSVLANFKNTLITYDVKEGNPLEEMIEQSKTLNPDLVVIGQKKGTSPHGILAKNMVRSSTANILVIPQGSKADITNILVPIDFSEASDKALELAIALHKSLNKPAKITCLHIYHMPNHNFFRNEAPWIEMKASVERNLANGLNIFIESIAGDYKHNIEIALIERTSTGTANYIMEYAKKNQVDFMTMGAKGHSKAHMLLMGSVAKAILDLNDNIPTLITR